MMYTIPAGNNVRKAADIGKLFTAGLNGTNHGLGVVGDKPSGTRRVSVQTGTKYDTVAMTPIAMGTP